MVRGEYMDQARKLVHEIYNCNRCEFGESRQRIYYGYPHKEDQKIAFIAENPGVIPKDPEGIKEKEERKLLKNQSPEGKTNHHRLGLKEYFTENENLNIFPRLLYALQEIGLFSLNNTMKSPHDLKGYQDYIEREFMYDSIYFTDVAKCRGNGLTSKHFNNCRDKFLWKELKYIVPYAKVIFAFGNTAINALIKPKNNKYIDNITEIKVPYKGVNTLKIGVPFHELGARDLHGSLFKVSFRQKGKRKRELYIITALHPSRKVSGSTPSDSYPRFLEEAIKVLGEELKK
jgi:uracil-DNA glycosylase